MGSIYCRGNLNTGLLSKKATVALFLGFLFLVADIACAASQEAASSLADFLDRAQDQILSHMDKLMDLEMVAQRNDDRHEAWGADRVETVSSQLFAALQETSMLASLYSTMRDNHDKEVVRSQLKRSIVRASKSADSAMSTAKYFLTASNESGPFVHSPALVFELKQISEISQQVKERLGQYK